MRRIELNGGTFKEEPQAETYRDIMRAYARDAEEIRKVWDYIYEGNR